MVEITPEEEEGEWEELDATTRQAIVPVTNDDARSRTTQPDHSESHQALTATTTSSYPQNYEDSTRRQDRLHQITRRVESKQILKSKLIRHPLQLFAGKFVVHLARELWLLQVRTRIALFLLLFGLATKVFVLSTACFWYPRALLIPLLVLGPFLYLNPNYLPASVDKALLLLRNPQELQLNSAQLRNLCLAVLMVPTFLEIRTIQFLSAQTTFTTVSHYNYSSFLVAAAMSLAMTIAYKKKDQSPRDCAHIGLLVLYGAALVIRLRERDVWNLPLLLAPFCLATGVLVLNSVDDPEWLSRAVRHALRLTLRDVLANVGDTVQQDEMLQLAMLRWIADYWASSPAGEETSGHQENVGSARASASTEGGFVPLSSNFVPVPRDRELKWSELLPMLSMTTEQMASEVQSLQAVDTGLATSSATAGSPSSVPSSQLSDPIGSFQSMLSSMDLDDRAKPAVVEYRRGVERFPPSHHIAIFISVARRCPALLTLLIQLIFRTNISGVVILLPFIWFELIRTKQWSESCKRAAAPSTSIASEEALFLENVDPMVILLSGDKLSLYRPPTLLAVWMNVCSSVCALEVSLTAARCVQTTAVAIDFAGNIMSLAQFGLEVAEYGWLHGLGVVARELLIHHSGSTRTGRSPDARYAYAASRAVTNSRRLTHNMRALMEEEHTSKVIQPVGNALAAIVGYGWLWGKDKTSQTAQSTVIIEEVDDDASEKTTAGTKGTESVTEGTTTVTEEAVTATVGTVTAVSRDNNFIGVPSSDLKDANPGEVNFTISAVLDLICVACERNLIDEHEKNSLCEKLVAAKPDCEQDAVWLEGTRRTLSGLLSVADHACTQPDVDSLRSVETPMRCKSPDTDPSRKVEPSSKSPDNEADDFSFAPSTSSAEIDDTNQRGQPDQCETMVSDVNASARVAGSHRDLLGIESASSSYKEKLILESESSTSSLHHGQAGFISEVGEEQLQAEGNSLQRDNLEANAASQATISMETVPFADDDDDFEPLDTSVSTASVKANEPEWLNFQAEKQDPLFTRTTPERENAWMQVSGGLAVLGAVMGVAATMALRSGGHGSVRRGRGPGR